MDNSWMWNLATRGQGQSHSIYPGLMPPSLAGHGHPAFQHFGQPSVSSPAQNLSMYPVVASAEAASPRPPDTDLTRDVSATDDEMRIMNRISQIYGVDMDHFKQWCCQNKGVNVHLSGQNSQPPNEPATTHKTVPTVTNGTALPENNKPASDRFVPNTPTTNSTRLIPETATSSAPYSAPAISQSVSTVVSTVMSSSQVDLKSKSTTSNISCEHTNSTTTIDEHTPSISTYVPPSDDDVDDDDDDSDTSSAEQEEAPAVSTAPANPPGTNSKRLSYTIMFKLQVAGFQELIQNQHATARAFGLSRDCVRRWTRQKHHLVKKYLAMDKIGTAPHGSHSAAANVPRNFSDTEDRLEDTTKSPVTRVKPEPMWNDDVESSEAESMPDINMSCTNEDYDANGAAFSDWSSRLQEPSMMDCNLEVINSSYGDKYCKRRAIDDNHKRTPQDTISYSVDHKLAIIDYYGQHGAKATKKNFGILKRKILNWIKHKADLIQQKHNWAAWKNNLSKEFPYSTTLEEMLVEWLKDTEGLVSWNMFSSKAELLASTVDEIKLELGSDSFTCDREYMELFTQKHGTSLCDEDKLENVLATGLAKNPGGLGQRKNSYPLSFKLQVIAYFEEGNSKAAAARKFGIARKQVQNWIQTRDHLFKHVHLGNFARLPGCGRKCMSKILEEKLLLWIDDTKTHGVRVSHSMLKNKAKELYQTDADIQKECSGKGFQTFHASQGWLRSFLRRNKILRKGPTPETNTDYVQLQL